MRITSLTLRNFRNYTSCSLILSEGVTLFLGNNAQGKTNLLEAIYLLSTTRSHRGYEESQCIRRGESSANLGVQIEEDGARFMLGMILHPNGKTLTFQKQALKRTSEFIGKLNAVMFSPRDMDLFETSPRERRKLMDVEMGKISIPYLIYLNRYQKVLKERNAYLKEKSIDLSYLEVLTKQCIDSQIDIIVLRHRFVDDLNEHLQDYFSKISVSEVNVKAVYKAPVDGREEIEQQLVEKFAKNGERDIVFRQTHLGVHRDDIEFTMEGEPVEMFASQGQKRVMVLAIKCALIAMIEKRTDRKPVLLLDDVLSELDAIRRKALFTALDPTLQTLITTTDLEDVKEWARTTAVVYDVENGRISKRRA
jgi:DNA replication and repair protein RecF